MLRLYSLFVLLDLALLVAALIDCLSAEEYAIRALPRIAWVFLILLFSPIGAIVWFVAGRPPRAIRMSNGEKWRPTSPQPKGPDDDPEFLRQQDEDLMKKWEADLRRREEELRKKDD